MKPKDKASQLIRKFANHSMGDTSDSNKNSAVNCALICAAEVVDNCEPESSAQNFWKEVEKALLNASPYSKTPADILKA